MAELSVDPSSNDSLMHAQPSGSSPSSLSSTPTSFSKHRSNSPLSIDLSAIPPLSQPAPPSNTLLITQLEDPLIFHPASLATIRQHITSLDVPLHSFAPLKSLRRIICSFYSDEDCIKVRQHLDGAAILGKVRARCYFGEPTPIGEEKKYLERPDAGRLFFISPPPSPPIGWEMRNEDPPNKEVHAEDLADALAKLGGKLSRRDDTEPEKVKPSPTAQYTREELLSQQKSAKAIAGDTEERAPRRLGTRSRSSTLMIYDPGKHGDSPGLPAVMVEDFTADDDDDLRVQDERQRTIAHTSRPPVELMEES